MYEVWRDVPCYEGKYQVSDHGRVRSLSRWVCVDGLHKHIPDRVIRLAHKGGGQYYVCLNNFSRTRRLPIKDLLWQTFYGGVPSGSEVYHRDGDKSNNCLANLNVRSKDGTVQKAPAQDILGRGRSGRDLPRPVRVIRRR